MQLQIYRSTSLDQLIHQCIKQDGRAQQALYERFSPKMYAVCLRYVKDADDAQDVLLKAFMKVFEHLRRFKGKGSFEGWIRRITVNEALMFLRKHKNMQITVDIEQAASTTADQYDQLEADDLMELVQALPVGYRTVFNLYAIEGYSHPEIAQLLNISEGTSKSQLSRAKEVLRQQITKYDRDYRDKQG